jgi:hypothetical protein
MARAGHHQVSVLSGRVQAGQSLYCNFKPRGALNGPGLQVFSLGNRRQGAGAGAFVPLGQLIPAQRPDSKSETDEEDEKDEEGADSQARGEKERVW